MKPASGLQNAMDALEQLATAFAATEIVKGKNRLRFQFVVSRSQACILRQARARFMRAHATTSNA
ncbi:hypothetical protein [Simplicispira lacusdiani]|uniref:hypothetical protein n=1 Tax=Simplicispira lacusdiani TaxID=2213010 RepID=UPI001E3BDE23|nr:hypothetical protein [Simplicispira lacusdiani]